MSCASQCVFDAPPLPRYRFHRKTGTWRKEKLSVHDGAANTRGAHVADGGALVGASPQKPQPTRVPFESSYDFFLRSVRPPQPTHAKAEWEARKRDATRVPIRDFEAALFKHQVCASTGRRGRATSDAPEKRSASLRSPKSVEATPNAAARTPHPLTGFASTASVPAVYAALASLKPCPFNLASHPALGDRICRSEFGVFLRAIGPAAVLSRAYQDSMFRTLPSYEAESDTVEALALLHLVLEHRYHPHFDANVTALFRSFDVDARGAVALEALHPDVIMAWAKVRTFGTLREQWSRLSVVLTDEMHNEEVRFPHMPELVSREAAGVLLSCTDALYAAMCTLDLDGASL